MKKKRKAIYILIIFLLILAALLTFFVSRKRIELKHELQTENELLQTREERLKLYEASAELLGDLHFNIAELEKKVTPIKNIPESIVRLCSIFEESGFELTGCFAGRAAELETDGGSTDEDAVLLMKQTVSLQGLGAAESVYDFIESIESSSALYNIESFDVTADSEVYGTDIEFDVEVSMLVIAE